MCEIDHDRSGTDRANADDEVLPVRRESSADTRVTRPCSNCSGLGLATQARELR